MTSVDGESNVLSRLWAPEILNGVSLPFLLGIIGELNNYMHVVAFCHFNKERTIGLTVYI